MPDINTIRNIEENTVDMRIESIIERIDARIRAFQERLEARMDSRIQNLMGVADIL